MMEELKRLLHDCGHSLVVANNGIRTYDGRGVSDLYRLLNSEPGALRGARIADKVVGKGAAALMAMANVGEVYADVVSRPAIAMLEKYGIKVGYGTLADHIVNRSGTGMCPLEMRCMACRTAEECLVQIRSFIEEMQKKTLKTSAHI